MRLTAGRLILAIMTIWVIGICSSLSQAGEDEKNVAKATASKQTFDELTAGKITAYTGEVLIRSRGTWKKLDKVPQYLYSADKVVTRHGRAKIVFVDGNYLLMDLESNVTITVVGDTDSTASDKRNKWSLIHVALGKVVVEAEEQGPRNYIVRTPETVAWMEKGILPVIVANDGKTVYDYSGQAHAVGGIRTFISEQRRLNSDDVSIHVSRLPAPLPIAALMPIQVAASDAVTAREKTDRILERARERLPKIKPQDFHLICKTEVDRSRAAFAESEAGFAAANATVEESKMFSRKIKIEAVSDKDLLEQMKLLPVSDHDFKNTQKVFEHTRSFVDNVKRHYQRTIRAYETMTEQKVDDHRARALAAESSASSAVAWAFVDAIKAGATSLSANANLYNREAAMEAFKRSEKAAQSADAITRVLDRALNSLGRAKTREGKRSYVDAVETLAHAAVAHAHAAEVGRAEAEVKASGSAVDVKIVESAMRAAMKHAGDIKTVSERSLTQAEIVDDAIRHPITRKVAMAATQACKGAADAGAGGIKANRYLISAYSVETRNADRIRALNRSTDTQVDRAVKAAKFAIDAVAHARVETGTVDLKLAALSAAMSSSGAAQANASAAWTNAWAAPLWIDGEKQVVDLMQYHMRQADQKAANAFLSGERAVKRLEIAVSDESAFSGSMNRMADALANVGSAMAAGAAAKTNRMVVHSYSQGKKKRGNLARSYALRANALATAANDAETVAVRQVKDASNASEYILGKINLSASQARSFATIAYASAVEAGAIIATIYNSGDRITPRQAIDYLRKTEKMAEETDTMAGLASMMVEKADEAPDFRKAGGFEKAARAFEFAAMAGAMAAGTSYIVTYIQATGSQDLMPAARIAADTEKFAHDAQKRARKALKMAEKGKPKEALRQSELNMELAVRAYYKSLAAGDIIGRYEPDLTSGREIRRISIDD